MTFYIVAAVACVLLSAFFSASEMALSSANRIRLENLMEGGSRPAAMAVKLLDRFDGALSTILIGNNFVNIALSSLGSLIAITAFGEKYTWLATVIVTVTVIVFGETIPKILARQSANRLSLVFAPILRVLSVLLWPLVTFVVWLTHLITAPMKGEAAEAESEAAVEELQSLIETAEDEGVVDEERGELLQAALGFDEVSASEAMTARVDMQAIDIDDDWEELWPLLRDSSHSRIPVYEGSVDNIIGVLHLNHFFRALLDEERPALRPLLMEPCFVYKTVKLPAVLEELRASRTHLAIVTDEYGGTLGLISMEDVLEELVGEIWDETDEIEQEVVKRGESEFELDGDMSVGAFCELLDWDEDELDTDSATVGGWTLERFGGFPEAGESFQYAGAEVTVLKMDDKRVEKVLVKMLPETAGDD